MKTAIRRLLLTPIRFSVTQLFRMGQVGWAHWYDSPSDYPGGDHPYLYQDSAGTTPVTAVGQSEGLILDRAYGGMRGPELTTNTNFDSDTAWTKASATISGGAATLDLSVDSYVYQDIPVTVGQSYAVECDITVNAGTLFIGQNGGTASTVIAAIGATTGERKLVGVITPTVTPVRFIARRSTGSAGNTAIISRLSLKHLPGTHRIQASAPSRPLLMARVNMLLASEDFSNAAWTKTDTTVTANSIAAPDGNTTADLLTEGVGGNSNVNQSITAVASAVHKARRVLKRGNSDWVVVGIADNTFATGARQWVNLATGALGSNSTFGVGASFSSASIENLGNGWYAVNLSGHIGATTIFRTYTHSASADASITRVNNATRYEWGADLRTADDAAKNIPTYQRVGATAADHDTAGFPHAAYPDGTDDFDTTSTGGGGSAGFFFCGVLTVSGGAGTARTIWSDTGTNTGYRVRINASNKLELAAGNGSAYTTVQSNETITAPGTYLLSAWDDGGVLAVQVGNAAAATTARPAVSAGTSTITSYRDNGAATSYFNGRDYGSVYRQTYPGETAHNRLKAWQARRAGITV